MTDQATPERGERMFRLIEELYPVCRSIMGPGTRATLDRIADEVPLQRHWVPSGQPVLDWVVPNEWTIRDASITRAGGHERLVDFKASNLHVVSHSVPIRQRVSLDELQGHLYSLPDRPHVIPYRTSYYAETWGFCLSHDQRQSLAPGDYDVWIDSSLEPGRLEWGELVVPGESDAQVLLTTHICHPSLANDNLTGIAALVEVARELLSREQLRYTYRLLFVPATIGMIAWLATSDDVDHVVNGLVVTGLGDHHGFTYKRSRRGTAEIDRIADVLLGSRDGANTVDFSPYGYDERQLCSPGFDLPVGRLTRGVHGEYPEYHTSADNLDFVSVTALDESVDLIVEIVDAVEANRRFRNTSPHGEPQLGRRGLYSMTGGAIDPKSVELAYLWLLSGSDGEHDLCDIARRSGLALPAVAEAAQRLEQVGLLETEG